MRVFHRVDRIGCTAGSGGKAIGQRRTASQHLLRLGNPAGMGLGATDGKPRRDDPPAFDTVNCQCHGQCKIAGTTVEFVEAEVGVGREQRQAHLGQQFILGKPRRHDPCEKLMRGNDARPANALRHHLRTKRR